MTTICHASIYSSYTPMDTKLPDAVCVPFDKERVCYECDQIAQIEIQPLQSPSTLVCIFWHIEKCLPVFRGKNNYYLVQNGNHMTLREVMSMVGYKPTPDGPYVSDTTDVDMDKRIHQVSPAQFVMYETTLK